MVEKLIDRREAAALLGLKIQTLAAWSLEAKHLPVVRCGRAVRYRPSDIQRFIEKRTVGPRDDGGPAGA